MRVLAERASGLAGAALLHQTTRTEAWARWFEDNGLDNGHPLRGPRFEQFNMIAQAVVCDPGVAILTRIRLKKPSCEAARVRSRFMRKSHHTL